MKVSKDTLWKSIIESLIDDFLWYFFPNYADQIDFERGFEFLDTELQKLIPDNPGKKRHADKLIKVWFKNGQEAWFLIHVEIQGYQDYWMGLRLFECIYRIRDKFQRPVTGLAIYTDWDRTYHVKEFKDVFLGSVISYQFNTYVLRDHTPAELANDPNPFAAVMEAAWQFLKKPKDEQKLAQLKLDMIRRLLKRNLPKDRIKSIIGFIALYVDFDNSEIKTKFEQDLMVITKATQPMGFEQAIQEEFKRQGIEIGEAKRDEELLNNAVPELLQEGFSAERIASILTLPLEDVQAAIDKLHKLQEQTSVAPTNIPPSPNEDLQAN
jgi:predicted transposase/invertase (TIGR01784 family)